MFFKTNTLYFIQAVTSWDQIDKKALPFIPKTWLSCDQCHELGTAYCTQIRAEEMVCVCKPGWTVSDL